MGSGPNPTIVENVQTDSSGNLTATVTTTSSRRFTVAGFVNTSRGRVDTLVKQTVNFSNDQSFTITKTTYTQDISQKTEVQSTTDTRQGGAIFETYEKFTYPVTVDYTLTFAADGSVSQLGNVFAGVQERIPVALLCDLCRQQSEFYGHAGTEFVVQHHGEFRGEQFAELPFV